MNLPEFIERHKASICAAVVRAFPPLYDAAARANPAHDLRRLLRRPLGGQSEAVRATVLSLRLNRGTVVVGEQGSGKTFLGAAASYLAGFERVLVMAPPHLVRKWRREIRQTVPGARTAIVRSLTDLDRLAPAIRPRRRGPGAHKSQAPGAPLFVIVSRERAKLGYRWVPCALTRLARDEDGRVRRDQQGQGVRSLACAACFSPLVDDEGIPLEWADLGEKRRKCPTCAHALWCADRTGPRRYPLADYVRRRFPGCFQLFIADECFPGSTLVATPDGATPIRSLCVGDEILSYRDGNVVTRRVVRTIKRRLTTPLVRVTHTEGSFTCTPNHKIYTTSGQYVEAAHLSAGAGLLHIVSSTRYRLASATPDEDLPDLRAHVHVLAAVQTGTGDVQPEVWRAASEAVASVATRTVSVTNPRLPLVWRDIRAAGAQAADHLLQQAVFDASTMGGSNLSRVGGRMGSEQVRATTGSGVRTDAAPEPGSRHQRQIGRCKAWRVLLRFAWWQRSVDAGADESQSHARMANGVPNRDGRSVLAVCQSGPRLSKPEDRRGVRREFPSHQETTQSGPAQRGALGRSWLDRAPILEFGDLGQSSAGPSRDQRCRTSTVLGLDDIRTDDAYVYDLEIEDTHCYFAEGVLVSNCHEVKGRGSAQGLAAATLAQSCEKTLALSATIFGGYSSTLFHLLRRFSPAVRNEFGYRDEPRWVGRYGIVHRITKRNPDTYTEDGRLSRRRNYVTRIVEKPGIAPAVLFHLLPNTVFLRLADVDRHLPPFTERVVVYPLDATKRGEASQAAAYRQLADALHAAVRQALAKGSKRLLATYLQVLLSYPDGCIRPELVLDKKTGDVIAAAPALPATVLYPKERALVELVREQRRRGRRVVVYVANTDTRDLTPRLKSILEDEGHRVAVLKANTVAPERREEWLAKQVEEGAEVLVCHPKLVQTGLDLLDWTTYVFYQVEFSVYVMRQASRRGWRIGQTEPVEVYHFAYDGTLQAEALALVAAKLRAAVLLDGDLPEDGLAALDDDGEDLFLVLARRLTEDTTADAASLESLFAQAQRSEADADEMLVEDDWCDGTTDDVLAPNAPLPEESAELQHRTNAQPPRLAGVGQLPLALSGDAPAEAGGASLEPVATAPPAGKAMTFDELALRVRRPVRRVRPPHTQQLSLLSA